MENLTIKGEYLFEFKNFNDWVDNAKDNYKPYKYGHHTIALDANNNVCHIGEDFSKVRSEKYFPVKVYSVIRTAKVSDFVNKVGYTETFGPYLKRCFPGMNGQELKEQFDILQSRTTTKLVY